MLHVTYVITKVTGFDVARTLMLPVTYIKLKCVWLVTYNKGDVL